VIDIVLEGAGCASHPEVGDEAFEKAKPRDERRLPLVPWGDAEPVECGSDVELREEFSTGQGIECLSYEGDRVAVLVANTDFQLNRCATAKDHS
jgi:hypothetical protein